MLSIACVCLAAATGTAETQRERGAYLVETLAACAGCHTPRTTAGSGSPLSGGNRYGPPQSAVYAPNITPDRTTGIGSWSDGQIIDAIRRGVRPDGSRLRGPMPIGSYAGLRASDLAALIAFLRSDQHL